MTQPLTGVQRFARGIARELVQQRDDVKILTPTVSPVLDDYADLPFTPVGRRHGHAWEQLDLPRYLKTAGSPLLLNLTSTGPMRYRNQIATHHDITYVRQPASFSWRFRLIYRLIVPSLLKRSRKVLTVSEFSKKEVGQHFGLPPEKLVIVHNAVDARFMPDPAARAAEKAPYFLAVSSPSKHKNFERMVEAFTRYLPESDTRLVIIGAQNQSFSALNFAQKTDRIVFTGRVDDDKLVSLYQRAKAFVFPSIYEGFGIPPLEAQQCGCPVIASNAASMPEVLRDSVVYFDPYDIASIQDAIRKIDSDAALRQTLI
ncbi:MAG: glycosyltransferase family 4 protein, partial [Verrucomicrobiae bacterium]|nr:glycosyltransferase family 4 protein [Verrucomicrobiae bacterium]